MATILAGDATRGAADRLRRRAAREGRDARGAVGLLDAVLAAATLVPLSDDAARQRRSTSSAPAATAATRSTSARWRRSSPPAPACRSASTARGRRRRSAAPPTCSRRSASRSSSPPEGVLRCIEQAGIGFCLAPSFHPAFRFAAPSRREIGIPTVFNLLGPMANPGRVRRQLIGVANPAVAERMLASLRIHGSRQGVGRARQRPRRADDHRAVDGARARGRSRAQLRGRPGRSSASRRRSRTSSSAASRAENADAVRRVLAGEHGAHRNIVVLNAGAALVVAERATSRCRRGSTSRQAAIDSGAAAATLERFVAESQAAKAAIAGLTGGVRRFLPRRCRRGGLRHASCVVRTL